MKVFVFFSSRLGWLGSIAVSLIVTLILLAAYHVVHAGGVAGEVAWVFEGELGGCSSFLTC